MTIEAVVPDAMRSLIVCPLCKRALSWTDEVATCSACGQRYPHVDGVWRMLPQHPPFMPNPDHDWHHGQQEFEEFASTVEEQYDDFLREIDGVREIYTDVYPLSGAVLDVGGYDGRLRHFLPAGTRYLDVDPYANAIRDLRARPNLVRAYPALAQPVAFVQGRAERLPVATESFDWVHMRSVLDHFGDAYIALAEARRVLVPGGRIIVGVHVTGGKSSLQSDHGLASLRDRVRKKLRDEGVAKTVRAAARRLLPGAGHDLHIWHPSYDSLKALLEAAAFRIEHEHWQKPPNDHVIYMMARK